MPKTFAQYSRFESGLNFKSDDEDLDNSSLAECIGWDISTPGEVTTIAQTAIKDDKSYDLTVTSLANSTADGKSFVVARSDFDVLSATGTDVNDMLSSEADSGNTLGFYNGLRYVNLVTDLEGTPTLRSSYNVSYIIDMGANGFPVCFWHEGELRVFDRTHSSSVSPKWFGVLKRTRFTSANTWNVLSGNWVTEDLHLKAPVVPTQSANGNGIVYFDETNTTGKLPNLAAGMPNLIMTQTTNSEDGNWESTEYEFGCTNVYKGNQESSITLMEMKKKNTDNNGFTSVDSYLLNIRQYFSGVNISFKNSASSDFPQRQTGCRIYIRKAGGGRRWRLFLDADFIKGAKRNSFDRIESSWTETGSGTGIYHLTSSLDMKNPSIETYEALTGVLNDEVSVGFGSKDSNGNGWGLAKAVSRRVFYLRAKYYTEDQVDITKLYDRVFYSQPARPDVVPTTNWIDLGINDGDEFIAMETYAGKLCLFKRNKIYILNVQNPNPMGWGLEQEIDNNGIPNPANVVLTRYGIIWANEYGCFMYGGQAPVELSQKIGGVKWREHLDNNSVIFPIGFHEKTNQLFITEMSGGDTTKVNCWVYTFATNGWTKRNHEFFGKNNGFTNNLNGDLILHSASQNKIKGYRVNTIGNSSNTNDDDKILTLKEDNFGSSGLTKRFYNIKIDVKNENNCVLSVYGNGSLIETKNLSANSDYVTKIYTFNPIVESDKMQIKIISSGQGGATIGNVVLEYRPKRLRVSQEGN